MLYDAAGWLGAFLILLAYFLVSDKKLRPESNEFQWLNLFGAVGVVINATHNHAWPSVGLNAVWFLVAIYGLIKYWNR